MFFGGIRCSDFDDSVTLTDFLLGALTCCVILPRDCLVRLCALVAVLCMYAIGVRVRPVVVLCMYVSSRYM